MMNVFLNFLNPKKLSWAFQNPVRPDPSASLRTKGLVEG